MRKKMGMSFNNLVNRVLQPMHSHLLQEPPICFLCHIKRKRKFRNHIDFVQTPYFSEKTVEKGKRNHRSEIQMYNDNPDWRLYFGTIENMYHYHPVKIDIAGTIDSIAKLQRIYYISVTIRFTIRAICYCLLLDRWILMKSWIW